MKKLLLMSVATLFVALVVSADEAADKATHKEVKPLDIEFKLLNTLCMGKDGNLLAADGETKELKVISPEGKVIKTHTLPFKPEAVLSAGKETAYCGGEGNLVLLNLNDGKILKSGKAPENVNSEIVTRRKLRPMGNRVAGLALTSKSLFVTFGSGWSTVAKAKLFKFDLDLTNPKLVAEGLKGCCQRADLTSHNDIVYLAENSVHRIVSYDADGKKLGQWGERGRGEMESFGSCCNPMNLTVSANGTLLTSESGLGRVKRYSLDGKFIELVGYTGVARFNKASGLAAACSNIAIAETADAKRIYVMDFQNKLIRVLEKI